EKEVDQRAIELRPSADDQRKACAGDLGAALEVEDAESFADVPVRFRSEIEFRLLAPCALDAIRAVVHTDRYGVVRRIGKIELQRAQLVSDAGQALVELLDLVPDVLHGLDLRGGIL